MITCLILLQDWLLMALPLPDLANQSAVPCMSKALHFFPSSQIKTLYTDTLVDPPLFGTIGASSENMIEY